MTAVVGAALTAFYFLVTVLAGGKGDRSITLPQILVSCIFGFLTAYGLTAGNTLLLIGPPLLFTLAVGRQIWRSVTENTATFRFHGRQSETILDIIKSEDLKIERDTSSAERIRTSDRAPKKWIVKSDATHILMWIQTIHDLRDERRKDDSHEDVLVSLEWRRMPFIAKGTATQSLANRIERLLLSHGAREVY